MRAPAEDLFSARATRQLYEQTPLHCYDLIPEEVLAEGIGYAVNCWEFLREKGYNPYEGGIQIPDWDAMPDIVCDPLTHVPLQQSHLRSFYDLLLRRRGEDVLSQLIEFSHL